jgi:hypothetical protein
MHTNDAFSHGGLYSKGRSESESFLGWEVRKHDMSNQPDELKVASKPQNKF